MRYTTTDAPNKPLNAIQEGSLGDKMGIAERRMRRRFHKPNRSQLHLLPISIDQWVDEDHLAQVPLGLRRAFEPGAVSRRLRR
jgi:hypothetical protein